MSSPPLHSRFESEFPLVQELSPAPDPFEALRRFVDLPGVLLFDSVQRHPTLGRFSYLTADPFHWQEVDVPRFGEDPLVPLRGAMSDFAAPSVEGLPPFQGGAAGMLGYEIGGVWERLRGRERSRLDVPDMAVGLYDSVIAWDHSANRAWIVSQGFPERNFEPRRRRAAARLEWMRERLTGTPRAPRFSSGERIIPETLLHRHRLGDCGEVWSTFSRESYIASVQRIIDYIRAGDLFQANLSQQLLSLTNRSPVELYERLRQVNPAPFAAYFAHGDWAVLSASPERFMQVRRGCVETRPIKGTRPRSNNEASDRRQKQELLASEKDRAENVMIVDLLRNDLSKVCRPNSVRVPELCVLETYATVHHLVSSIVGVLEADQTAWDLLAASFPGGSITGAPKVRATEILRELEPTARGPYCGTLFHVGFDGSCDSSILIRTMVAKNGMVRIGVGGGVTAASDPEAEYEETIVKARGMLSALDDAPAERLPTDGP